MNFIGDKDRVVRNNGLPHPASPQWIYFLADNLAETVLDPAAAYLAAGDYHRRPQRLKWFDAEQQMRKRCQKPRFLQY